jgi:hypothetical protein
LENVWSKGHKQSSYSFDGVVHALKEHDPIARMHVHVCNWFLQSVYEGEVDTQLLFFCHETWFSLRGEVNSQNIAIGMQKIQDFFMNSLFMTKKFVLGFRARTPESK